MKGMCEEVLRELGVNDPMLAIAQELEKVALEDEYFKKRKLYPNVDYYSGIMLRAIGIPTSMFTVMFAMSRTVGWISQWNEMISEGQMRIGRPRQLYCGQEQRAFTRKHLDSVHIEPPERPALHRSETQGRNIKNFSDEQAAITRQSSLKITVPPVSTR